MSHAFALPRPHVQGLPAVRTFRAFNRDPLAALDHAKATWGDRARFAVAGEHTVLLSDPEDIAEVLVTRAADFRKDVGTRRLQLIVGPGLLTLEGDTWRQRRKLAAPSLKRAHIASYADVMVRHTEEAALDLLAHPEGRDLHAVLMGVTLRIVVECLLGTNLPTDVRVVEHAMADSVAGFAGWQQSWRRFLPGWVPTAPRRRMRRGAEALDAVIRAVIAQRRQDATGNDLLSRLMVAQDEAGLGLDDEALRGEVATMFLAGHETTALALLFALHLLSRHPAERARAEAEIQAAAGDGPLGLDHVRQLPFTAAVITEAMRLYPPAWAVGREALTDLEDLRCGPVRKGTQLIVSPWLVHRDARWHAEPLRFVPQRWIDQPVRERPRFTYLPFGGGPRVCIGNHFAEMEAVLVLATLLRRVRLDVPQAHVLQLRPSITLRPTGAVPVRVTANHRPD
ncbi:MAG: cytochrome P450 [Myxococcales bacterium]|nr:cytochrome P450 [Myxococcales bacterium]